MANRLSGGFDNYRSFYRSAQIIENNDMRSLDERIRSLPVIRDEDLPEWKEWAEANVLDNR